MYLIYASWLVTSSKLPVSRESRAGRIRNRACARYSFPETAPEESMSAFARLRETKSRGLPDAAFRQMVDAMPVNVIICDLKDFKITYVNESTRATLTKIE